MPSVDLYDGAYGKYDLYSEIRLETYGEDLGQTSWVTTEESYEIPRLLELTRSSVVLELGCGSGRYGLRVAEQVGCRITGVDVNSNGIRNANELAQRNELDSLVRFEQCDISKKQAFGDGTFDAVFANDVLCHIPGRAGVVEEIFRILKPGGRFLFSDALVIGGVVSHEEIATRSSVGYYLFSPPGENERFIKAAGFRLVSVNDTTAKAAQIAGRWHDARERRKDDLIVAEGQSNFEGLQRFLSCVEKLTCERRLLRYLYLAERTTSISRQ
jgi:ubiquinone/menaquinone biosynthesis C-methylase UbiE